MGPDQYAGTGDGSPPRAWGIQIPNSPSSTFLRFTPTCVGNTYKITDQSIHSSVHPHVRGEYTRSNPAMTSEYGSPPRAWGILCQLSLRKTFRRFTPTCVGNTPDAPARPSKVAVHPHVRGEYVTCNPTFPLDNGSPPRAWGILIFRAGLPRRSRFTPTCVGNTGATGAGGWASTVHPHVRGEY